MGEPALPNRYELRTSERGTTGKEWEDAIRMSGGRDTRINVRGQVVIVYFSATDKQRVIAGVQRLRGKNFGVRVVKTQ